MILNNDDSTYMFTAHALFVYARSHSPLTCLDCRDSGFDSSG
jgi:hypothetical protein